MGSPLVTSADTNAAGPGGNLHCTPADGLGAQEQFSPEKLGSLYKNHGGYVNTVLRRVLDLEQDGWLLPADANELRVEAAEFDGI